MIIFFAIVFTVAAIAVTVVAVKTATFTVKIDGERIAVFYGSKSFRWYRKNCGSTITKYRLIAIRF